MSLAQVKEFHEAFGHPVAEERGLIPFDRFKLRKELIREELDETLRDFMIGDLVKFADGLADLDVVINGALMEFGMTEVHPEGQEYYTFEHFNTPNLGDTRKVVHMWTRVTELMDKATAFFHDGFYGEVIDALCDAKYVVNMTAGLMGIPQEEICTAVHKANMSKLGADGKPIYREDGKILKGPNFRPPEEDIEAILKAHGAEL